MSWGLLVYEKCVVSLGLHIYWRCGASWDFLVYGIVECHGDSLCING